MPEIAEVARVVHFLRKHLVGKTIRKADAIDDGSVFGKVGTSGAAFASSVQGKEVVSAGSQGKYLWIILDSPPHPVMHFGMTGWIHIKGERTGYTTYYNKMKAEEIDRWPPKFCKFELEAVGKNLSHVVHVAFTDPRRFGRVRLVDCPGDRIRQTAPLVDNGPDPVVDRDTTFTCDYVVATLRRRHVPIKALLLDQAFLSGIGNWVGDEVLFQAAVHPEQYSNTLSDAQMEAIYKAIQHVCGTAVALLGDSDRFPDDWLFHHRWGKGNATKGGVVCLPSGERLAFLTVGGRTSCYAPERQKKSGALAAGIKEEPAVAAGIKKKPTVAAGKEKTEKAERSVKPTADKKRKRGAVERGSGKEGGKVKEELKEEAGEQTTARKQGKRAAAAKTTEKAKATVKGPKSTKEKSKTLADSGQRRSSRIQR